jgi:predicted nucleic acid-binding protein
MIVVTDSNIIFSALYTPNGVIASILKNKNKIQLLAPNFLILEVKIILTKY